MSNAQSWTHYWQQGHVESCIDNQSSDNNELKHAWQTFSALITPEACVVDLATGNGSVLKKLAEFKPNAEYVGVDYATVDPQWAIGVKNVNFISDTSIDALPFSNESVDIITSQFGFEYGMNANAINELIRVLKPRGYFQLIIHHELSEIVLPAKRRHYEIDLVLASNSLIEAIEGYLDGLIDVSALESTGKTFLEKNQSTLSQSISGQCFSVINKAVELQSNNDLSSAVHLVARLKDSLVKELARLSHLISVAQSEQKIDWLAEQLNKGQIKVEIAQLETNEQQILAWVVKGQKHE